MLPNLYMTADSWALWPNLARPVGDRTLVVLDVVKQKPCAGTIQLQWLATLPWLPGVLQVDQLGLVDQLGQ